MDANYVVNVGHPIYAPLKTVSSDTQRKLKDAIDVPRQRFLQEAKSILTGTYVDKPIVQILSSKKILNAEEKDRFRLLISDGKNQNGNVIMATELNDLHRTGHLQENTIVCLDTYDLSNVDQEEIWILKVSRLTVLHHGSQVRKRLGNPTPYTGEKLAPRSHEQEEGSFPVNTTTENQLHNSSFDPEETQCSTSSMSLSNMLSTLEELMEIRSIASLKLLDEKFTIKARVTAKSAMLTWRKADWKGKYFSIDLIDESGAIKAAAFCNIAEKYFDIIEANKVYYISNCKVKTSDKKYGVLNRNYEMTFTTKTTVQLCEDDGFCAPKNEFNLTQISQIAKIEQKASIDIIGVCNACSEIINFVSKTNKKDYTIREITLVDSSNASVTLTLWGNNAVNFDARGHLQSVILVKGGLVSDFGGGKTISVGATTSLKINPDILEARKLREWFKKNGAKNTFVNISPRRAR